MPLTTYPEEEDEPIRHTPTCGTHMLEPVKKNKSKKDVEINTATGIYRPKQKRKGNQEDIPVSVASETSSNENKEKEKKGKKISLHKSSQNKRRNGDVSTRHSSIKGKRKINKTGKNKLVVLYTNADTLSNKMNLLLQQIDKNKPHIICITEVKPKNYRYSLQTSEINIEGYIL